MEQIITKEVYEVFYNKLKVQAVKIGGHLNGTIIQVKHICPHNQERGSKHISIIKR